MKLAAWLVIALTACAGTVPAPAPPATACPAPGAGTLEMKAYFLVVLRRGPAWSSAKTPETAKLSEGHMANIEAMARTGKLVIAGPIDASPTDPSAMAGIFIFDVPSRADVEALIQGDPAIAAQRLVAEILPWYGPAGLSYPGQAVVRGK